MPAIVAGLRFPCERVLLARTRLAYVHLRNLLSDAKRDRSARLSGYVAVWLPEEFVLLFLQHGEVANATIMDARGWRAVAIASALEQIPAEPEYGEICFHEAENDQLAAMFVAQTSASDVWPPKLVLTDQNALLQFLRSIMFDGAVEIVADGAVNYLLFRAGAIDKAYLSAGGTGSTEERIAALFASGAVEHADVRRWPIIPPLPVQAPAALIQAYRDLSNALVQRLVAHGREGAPAIAEQARKNLLKTHPELDSFAIGRKPSREPIDDASRITAAVASWLKEFMWAAADHVGEPPESLLKELTWERRHMFQSAGFYDKIPWKVM